MTAVWRVATGHQDHRTLYQPTSFCGRFLKSTSIIQDDWRTMKTRLNRPFLKASNTLYKTLQETPWKGRFLAFKTVCHISITCCNYTVYRPLGIYDSTGLRFARYNLYLGNSGAISCLAFNGRLTSHSPVVTIYTASNIQQSHVLPTRCIYMFGSENKQRLFPYTTLTGWVL